MPLLKEAVPMGKELQHLPPGPLGWFLPSLFAAFNVVLLVVFSGLFFAFPCRWLAQHGNWAFALVTGLLFIPTFFSLVWLNFSDPGILHRGSVDQSPMTVHVVWVNHRAFRLQWCPKCCFHRPPRACHCPWCNICVEDFDHHCKWVNNCIGQRNFRYFMLLVLSLCLYLGALLVTCLFFLVHTSHLPFCLDKAMAILVAVPATGFLVPLFLLLLLQSLSVSAAERSYEGKCRYLQGYNPFDQGCVSNWYLAICAPLGPKYMAEAVWLQRTLQPEWAPMHFPANPCTHRDPPIPSDPQPQPPGCHPVDLQQLPASPVLPLPREAPEPHSASHSPLRTPRSQERPPPDLAS